MCSPNEESEDANLKGHLEVHMAISLVTTTAIYWKEAELIQFTHMGNIQKGEEGQVFKVCIFVFSQACYCKELLRQLPTVRFLKLMSSL